MLRKKLKYLIRVFAKEYFIVLLADFTEDMVEISNVSEPVVPLLSQTLARSARYEDFYDFYCENYVCEQDRDLFRKEMDRNEIIRRLSDSGTYNVSVHHMYQERNCPTEITLIDVSDAQDGSECIIAARFIEDIVRQETALKKQDDMVGTLVQDYNAIYNIDLDKDTFVILQAHNVVNEDLYDYAYRNMPYQAAMKKFVDEMVREEDREIMLRISSCEYIKDRLSREDGYSYRYQVTPMRGMQYFEMRIVRARTDASGHFAIMTVRNVDKTAREELRAKREIEKANKELAQALETAENANRSKTDFLSRMSHDIRTPMNAIIGLTAIADANIKDKEKLRDCLEKINSSSHYLLGIINDILDMSRIESGNIEVNEGDFIISDIVKETVELVHPQIREKKQELKVHISNIADENVVGDGSLIQQAFVNILDNAVKYTPEGGHIVFSVEQKESAGGKTGTYMFTFSDDGIGMSPDFLKKIYEPFEREEDLRVSKIQGTGLGMAITRNIIHLMGGTINVESERGRGTCFTVVLPLKLQDISQEHGSGQNDEAHGEDREIRHNDLGVLQQEDFSDRRVLLVEDNEINREIMMEIISTTGVAVETAGDGMEAVDMFSKHPEQYYDMILMDIQMPKMNGYEASRTIRALERGDAKAIPVIALTANTFAEDIDAALQAGMNEHLAKPVSLNRLDDIMNRWFSRV